MTQNKGGYMDENGCAFSGVWVICSYILPDYVNSLVHEWYYLQVGLCAVADYCYAGVDLSLDQIEDL